MRQKPKLSVYTTPTRLPHLPGSQTIEIPTKFTPIGFNDNIFSDYYEKKSQRKMQNSTLRRNIS